MFTFLKPPPHLDEIKDQAFIDKTYRYWRWRIFYSMYAGYVFYYLSRKSFTFAIPSMLQDLGFAKADVGFLGTILAISYGLSKFLSGLLADRSNARYFMATGLFLTGVFNLFFGLSSSLALFAVFWGMNGLFQGWGWAPVARLLTHWYSQSERGKWWGSWSTAHSVGGFLIPLLAAFSIWLSVWLSAKLGIKWLGSPWRMALFVPGALCIIMSLVLVNRLRDTPQSLGLPAIEKFRNDYPSEKAKVEQERELSTREILVEYVLKNKYIWVLSVASFFVYVIRTAVNDWTMVYLVEQGSIDLMRAGICVGMFEIGGIFGSLTAGWLSDILFKGRRGPINVIFCFGLAFAVLGFWCSPYRHWVIDSAWLALIGFLTFGPQMLLGMCAAELSHKKAAATATGFLGWISYLGAASAGMPLGYVADKFGWNGFYLIVIACALVSGTVLLPLWWLRSKDDRSRRFQAAKLRRKLGRPLEQPAEPITEQPQPEA